MKVRYSGFNSLITLEDYQPLNIIVERPREYFNLLASIRDNYCNKVSNDFMLFNDEGEIKDVCYIESPFEININSPGLFKALVKYLEKQPIFEALNNESIDLQFQLKSLIDQASSSLPLTVYTQESIDWSKLFQAFGVQLEEGETLVDYLINYADIHSFLNISNTFIMPNLKSYLELEELQEVYKTFQQREYQLIVLGQYQTQSIDNERVFILDRDLCEISDIL